MRSVTLIAAIPLLAYFMWSFGKWANYTLAYKRNVQETVREMVKQGCLK